MFEIIKSLNKNIIFIILVGSFNLIQTPVDIFEEVEHDIILNKINIENMINDNWDVK